MTAAELCTALVRTTLVTSAAACLAALLLKWLRVDSPRIHRAAWVLVVLQGWLLLPWTVEIETLPPVSAPPNEIVKVTSESVSVTPPRPSTASVDTPVTHIEPASFRVPALAILAWLTGATLLTFAAMWRYGRIIRALPLGAAIDNPQWEQEWCRQRTSMGVRSRVEFRLTRQLGPLVAYIPFAYLVLAPRTVWTALAPNERTAILRHELAHIRRRDLWKSLALRVLALPQWFNPLVWLAVRRFDEAAEWACDAAACDSACETTAVASALVHTAELTASYAPVRAAGMIPAVPSAHDRRHSSAFSRRIRRLVTPIPAKESTMKKLLVPTILVIVAAGQLIRVERVTAKPAAAEFEDPYEWDLGAQLNRPLGVRREMAAARHRQLLVARERAVTEEQPVADAASAATAPTAKADPAKRREYKEAAWPRYIIEPPDNLLIEGVKLIPKPPYHVEPFDVLLVRVKGAFPDQPIDDSYAVDPNGSVNLGPTYGRIKIAGLTIEETEARLRDDLAKIVDDVDVSVSLVASAGAQQITGQHLVGPDGRVNLGIYGAVFVAGLTIEQSRAAIEHKLSDRLDSPQVSVDVLAYNSKVYYVINKGSGAGDHVTRLPITGNETVLDAIASVGGISKVAGAKVWVARPAPNGIGAEQILPIAWNDIADGSSTDTNYQLMPGDRLFIETQPAKNNAIEIKPKVSPALIVPPTNASPDSNKSVSFDIVVFEDPDGTLSEFKDLRDTGFMVGDSATTLGALRVFEKHKLVKRTADPRLICEVGRPASVEINADDPNARLKVEIRTGRAFGQPSQVDWEIRATQGSRMKNVETVVDFYKKERRTAVLKLDASTKESGAEAKSDHALYVVVTLDWPK